MGGRPTNKQIIGVALVLFSGILLAVGIHHMVATGTCSSTGYSANYGPVPTCPSGTGYWFAFLFGGIIGCLAGAAVAGSLGLVFAGIFGGIGFGSLSILLDSSAHGGTKVFAAVFGGCFAIVGAIAWIAVIGSAISSVRSSSSKPARGPSPPPPSSAPDSGFATSSATAAFGASSDKNADPIMSAYAASRNATPSQPVSPASTPVPRSPSPTPMGLMPGLQAAKQAASTDAVDELSKLADLHKRGALTDQEFANAKAKLLGEM